MHRLALARHQAAVAVNVSLTSLYWRLGGRIHRELLRGDRAGYGETLMEQVAGVLTAAYGRGFTRKNLWRMVQFAEAFLDEGNCRHTVATIELVAFLGASAAGQASPA